MFTATTKWNKPLQVNIITYTFLLLLPLQYDSSPVQLGDKEDGEYIRNECKPCHFFLQLMRFRKICFRFKHFSINMCEK